MKKIIIALAIILIFLAAYLLFKDNSEIDEIQSEQTRVSEIAPTVNQQPQENTSSISKPTKNSTMPADPNLKLASVPLETKEGAQKQFAELGYKIAVEDIKYFDTSNPSRYPKEIPVDKKVWGGPITEMRKDPSDPQCYGKTYVFIDSKTGALIGNYFLRILCA